MQIKIAYKYTVYQSPVIRTLDHFVESIHNRIEQIEDGLLDLQVSPLILSGRSSYWLMFLDIEHVIQPNMIDDDTIQLKTFTGRGIHVFRFQGYKIPNIRELREKVKANDKLAKLIDISTSLRVTPMRYIGAFSEKHKVWLHPYTFDTDKTTMEKLAKKPPSEFLKTQYAKEVCRYLHIEHRTDLECYAELITKPLQKIQFKGNTDDFLSDMQKVLNT